MLDPLTGEIDPKVVAYWHDHWDLNAILQRDYALVQGAVLFVAFNFMIVNLAVDLAYFWLDPRIRAGGR